MMVRHSEQEVEQGADRAVEQDSDRAVEQDADRAVEQGSDRAVQGADQEARQGSDRAVQGADQEARQDADRAVEKGADRENITINITAAAAEHFRKCLSESESDSWVGIRISMKETGCSGFSYVTEVAETLHDNDLTAQTNSDITIVIEEKYRPYLNGLTIDFAQKTLGQSQLVYTNPNETGKCGCGESFSVTKKT